MIIVLLSTCIVRTYVQSVFPLFFLSPFLCIFISPFWNNSISLKSDSAYTLQRWEILIQIFMHTSLSLKKIKNKRWKKFSHYPRTQLLNWKGLSTHTIWYLIIDLSFFRELNIHSTPINDSKTDDWKLFYTLRNCFSPRGMSET